MYHLLYAVKPVLTPNCVDSQYKWSFITGRTNMILDGLSLRNGEILCFVKNSLRLHSLIMYDSDGLVLYCSISCALTRNLRGPIYLGLIGSISWLLMPWLLTSPEHQQPWYWLCRIGRFLSYLRKDFNYLRHTNVEKWHKMWICVYVPSEKFTT